MFLLQLNRHKARYEERVNFWHHAIFLPNHQLTRSENIHGSQINNESRARSPLALDKFVYLLGNGGFLQEPY
jgi:hypothetical protein